MERIMAFASLPRRNYPHLYELTMEAQWESAVDWTIPPRPTWRCNVSWCGGRISYLYHL